MKLIYLSTFLFCINIHASEVWKTGDTAVTLMPISDQGFVSKSCLKDCDLKKKAKASLKKLSEVDTNGGKDPASGYCKTIGGTVTYYRKADDQEAFCTLKDDIISLSLLIPSKD